MADDNPFYVSKRNKRGVIALFLLSLCIVFAPRVYLAFKPNPSIKISSEDIRETKMQSTRFSANKKDKYRTGFSNKRSSKYQKAPAKFDPNLYSLKQWMQLGLSKKQAEIVLKFTERNIYSNDQLKKIFVISDELFALIKDSTFYPEDKRFFENNTDRNKNVKKIVLVELNSASQEEIESIPGIGAFFAKNIIKQRDKLGGFVAKEQLLEVWKMDIEKLESIQQYISIDKSLVTAIKLNTCSAESLKNHPYINWGIANSIVKMRTQKTLYKSIHEIKESVLIDEELFEKLKPYLDL
jgi:DNA uptake protein ComE-like DNA-binding protein